MISNANAATSIPEGKADQAQDEMVIVHGFMKGGAADTISHLIAGPLSKRLGIPVTVRSIEGGEGNVAAETVARAVPDGRTIGFITGGYTAAKGLYRSLPFDPIEDFSMISTVVEYNLVLAVQGSNPAHTLSELLEAAKARPGGLRFGAIGLGSTHHLTGEMLADMTGVTLTHVSYPDEDSVVRALLTGEVPLIVARPVKIAPHVQDGRLVALAVTSKHRWSGMPEVPTVAEAGVDGFDIAVWAGVLAPKGLAEATRNRLRREILSVLADVDTRNRIEAFVDGAVITSTAEEMYQRIARETAHWSSVIQAAGIERR